MVDLLYQQASAVAAKVEQRILADGLHLVVSHVLPQQAGVALALGAALGEQGDIFVGTLFLVVLCQGLGQRTDVGIEYRIHRHGAVNRYEIFRSGECKMPSVGGQDTAAHRIDGVVAGSLLAVNVVLYLLVEELQMNHPAHS